MKRIKIIQLAISFLQSFKRIFQGQAKPVAKPVTEAKEASAKQTEPEWKESDRLIALKKKLAFLEQDFKRVSTIVNPHITQQEADIKRNVISDRLEVAADLLVDIPIMEKCPISPFCEKCRDTSNIYHSIENLFTIVEFQLQYLEFGSCQFVSHFKDNIPVS